MKRVCPVLVLLVVSSTVVADDKGQGGHRVSEGVSSDGGAALDRISQGRCSMLELLASKGARAVLRGGGAGDSASLPDPATRVRQCRQSTRSEKNLSDFFFHAGSGNRAAIGVTSCGYRLGSK